MLPTINIGPLRISSFALMVFLGVLFYLGFSLFVLIKIEKKSKRVIKEALTVSALSFAALFVGALLFNSLFHTIENGYPTFGGITWEGGVLVGFCAFILLSHFIVKRERGREIELFSSVMPGIVMAHAFGRVGCFLGGCCFGRITEGPLGVVFPDGSPAAELYPNTQTGVGSFTVLPTQLFEAGFELVLFIVMITLYKRIKNDNLAIYLVFYSIFRFVLEFWRGDNRGATGLSLSPSQLMSILLFALGILIFLFSHGIIFGGLKKKCEDWRAEADSGIYDYPKTLSAEQAAAFAELEVLFRLKNEGAITDEEYDNKKKELLEKI